jgi:methylated-DNA-[protein]-cysteine S-methyltransferase
MTPTPAFAAKLETPFAVLGMCTDGRALTRLTYLPLDEPLQAPTDAVADRAARELARYLDDPAYRFSVPLATGGTAFQQRVWQALHTIPPGESRTYGEVARMVRSAARAVGQACGANRIALIIPCHRVVGAMGSLGGFMNAEAGDPIVIKRWLLRHEGYRFGR